MKFNGLGVKDGDPISTAVFILFIFIMWTWLTNASVTPVPFIAAKPIISQSLQAFNFLLIVLIPLTILLILQSFGAEIRKTEEDIEKTKGKLVRIVYGPTKDFKTRTEARRKAQREKRTPFKSEPKESE